MLLDFETLKAAGFTVTTVNKGVEIHPRDTNDRLPMAMSDVLREQEFTDMERDIIIEAAIDTTNRMLITRALR
jgi:hypothetical protein